MAKYGISKEFEPPSRKGGLISYFLLFLLLGVIFFLLLKVLGRGDLLEEYLPANIYSFSKNTKQTTKINETDNRLEIVTAKREVTGRNSLDDNESKAQINTRDDNKALPENEDLSGGFTGLAPEPVRPEDKLLVLGDMEELPSLEFIVSTDLKINREVTLKELSQPYMLEQILPNGRKIQLMSDSVEAEIIKLAASLRTSTSPLVLDKIRFYHNSNKLKESSLPQIFNLAEIMQAFPKIQILLRGHTDNAGTAKHNKNLSTRRAWSAKRVLIAKGINAKRIKVKGMGETEPLFPNTDVANRLKNRRLDLVITE